MKRKIVSMLVLACLALCLVSCGNGEVHVKSMKDFYKACTDAQKKGTQWIILDNDITWDNGTYNLMMANPFVADVTGVTIDLNGHEIANVSQNSLDLRGSSFTIMNGKISAARSTEGYCLVINWFDTDSLAAENYKKFKDMSDACRPASFEESDQKWHDRVRIVNMELQGLGIAYTPAEIVNCKIFDAQYKGINMWGSSGIIQDVDIYCMSEFGLSVTNWANVIVKGKGTIECPNCSVYTADGAHLVFDKDSSYVLKVSDMATKTVYANKKSSISISGGTTVLSGAKKSIAMSPASYVEIAKGATVYSYGEIMPNITGMYYQTTDYLNWSSLKGDYDMSPIYEGQVDFQAAKIVDNR